MTADEVRYWGGRLIEGLDPPDESVIRRVAQLIAHLPMDLPTSHPSTPLDPRRPPST